MLLLKWTIISTLTFTVISTISWKTVHKPCDYLLNYVHHIIKTSFNLEISSEITAFIIGENYLIYNSFINNIFEKSATNISWRVINYEKIEGDFDLRLTLQHGFIFLPFSIEEKKILESLEDILEKLLVKRPWNHLTKFIFLTEKTSNTTSSELAKNLLALVWKTARIINVIIVVFTEENSSQNTLPILAHEEERNTSIASYTLFPYQHGNCQEIKKIHLLTEFSYDNKSEFWDIDYFPSKIPNDFQGCVMTVTPYGLPPNQITTKYTDKNGNVKYKDSGLYFRFLQIFAQRFNITLKVLKPVDNYGIRDTTTLIVNIMGGKSDFVIRTMPIIPYTSLVIDFSIPIIHDPFKIQTPCPKPTPRVKRVMSIFTLTVWLSTVFVYVLISVLLWVSSKRSEICKSRSFKKLSQCFQNSWAILTGVSVSEIPKSRFLRYIFVLYVAFYLAVSTIFQSFFITFLIEPGYERSIETAQDLIERDIKFGWSETAKSFSETVDITEVPRQIAVVCPNVTLCIEHTMFVGNTTILVGYSYPFYIALVNGVQDTSTVVCFYKQDVFAGLFSIGAHKGYPILHELNKILRSLIELGFDIKSRSEIKHITKLKSFDKIQDTEGYFVFSLKHLAPVFSLITCGYVLCTTVFLLEVMVGNYKKFRSLQFSKLY